jgi:hypothetical protein
MRHGQGKARDVPVAREAQVRERTSTAKNVGERERDV